MINKPSFLAGGNTTWAGDKMSPTIKPGILISKFHFDSLNSAQEHGIRW